MKPIDWSFKKRKKYEGTGYVIDPIRLFSEHHYISREFDTLYIELHNLKKDELRDFMIRFSKDYRLLVKLPTWHLMSMDGDTLSDSIQYVKNLMGMGVIRGVVLEVGPLTDSNGLYLLEYVFMRRVLQDLTRNGIDFFLSNDVLLLGKAGVSLSSMLILKKKYPELRLLLNLHNSVLSGQMFMDVYKKNKSIGGLSKNFDVVLLNATGVDNTEIVPTTEGDIYDLSDYRNFLGQFPKKLIVYKGDFDTVVSLNTKLKVNGQ